jgi:hypothetical protein
MKPDSGPERRGYEAGFDRDLGSRSRQHIVSYPFTLTLALALDSIYLFGHWLRARSNHRQWTLLADYLNSGSMFLVLIVVLG